MGRYPEGPHLLPFESTAAISSLEVTISNRRTVASVLRILGCAQKWRFMNVQRILNYAAWRPRFDGRVLHGMLVSGTPSRDPVTSVPKVFRHALSPWNGHVGCCPVRETSMNALIWLISKITQFIFGRGTRDQHQSDGRGNDHKANNNVRSNGGNFDADYRAATNILKRRIDKIFPDNYYAKSKTEASGACDPGEDRAAAIDTMSATIATSLRNGASVQQAAAAGAASIGI